MADTIAARRYAEALFTAAREGNQIDAIEQDLLSLNNLSQRSPQFLEALRNPLIPAERKRHIISQLFSDSLQQLSVRFLNLLVDKRRSDILPDIYALFVDLANAYRNVVPAYVTTAVPLTAAEEEKLIAKLQKMTGKQIQLHAEVQPEILGGVRVRVGDTVIDGSVTGYLRQLREKLKETLI